MKKSLIVLLIIVANSLSAQKDLYNQVIQQIKQSCPGCNTDNKLLVINTWSSSDQQKREFNMQMQKALTTFGSAKLKGGLKGVIGVVINTGDSENTATITLDKDHVTAVLKVEKEGLNLDGVSNLIFDSQGNVVYKSLEPGALFKSIHQLITR